ncbi:MAG: ABC transporter substrate-binding protein [Acidimicrobiia bacterium]
MLSRREFMRLAALAGAGAALGGTACSSEGTKAKTAASSGAGNGKALRIAQWGHFVPAYDEWFDDDFARRWGEDHDISVEVDHIPFADIPARGDAEAEAGFGHDIFGFVDPPPGIEDKVIDHRGIVEEVEAKIGPMTPLVERSIHNPKTNKYFGFADSWVANVSHYRSDLWDQVEPGLRPTTWEDVRRAGPGLEALGFPLGIGYSEDADSSYTLLGLMHAFGASVQDEEAQVVIDRPATVEAVKFGAELFRSGVTDEVFVWDAYSNNRYLTTGRGSMVVNAISAIRAAEKENAELARSIQLSPVPSGPTGPDQPLGVYVTHVYAIWNFSTQQELAQQFLVDLSLGYREAFVRSEFYNLPAFPGSVPDLAQLVTKDEHSVPDDKYAFLADATKWSTNIGSPGPSNAAIIEVFNQDVITAMFAAAARGEMTPEEAVAAAEARVTPIYDKWRERGKI